MNFVLEPLPAPGAPPKSMISLGKRGWSRPTSVSSFCHTAPKISWASLISRSVMRGATGATGSTAWGVSAGVLAGSVDIWLSPDAQSDRPLWQAFLWEPEKGFCGLIIRAISVGESLREHLVEAGPGGVAKATQLPLWIVRFSGTRGTTQRVGGSLIAGGPPCAPRLLPQYMRVLIVDDEPSIRKTTRIAVESSGHVAAEAANAAKGHKEKRPRGGRL